MAEHVITVHELKKCINDENVVLIDVRTPQEREMFHIGGTLIPLQDLPSQIARLDKDKTIILYCHTGARSMMAVELFLKEGFNAVKSLAGGIVAWQAEELSTA